MNFDFELFAPLCHLFENSGLASNVSSILPYLGSQVLLVGAGSGIVAKCLESNGRTVYGIDRSSRMCNEALVRRGFRWECVDAAVYIPDRRFDSVLISTGVLTPINISGFVPILHGMAESALHTYGTCVCALFAETRFDRLLATLGFESDELVHRLHAAAFRYERMWPNLSIDCELRNRLERLLHLLKKLYEHAVAEGVKDPLKSLHSDREYFRKDEIIGFCMTLSHSFGVAPKIQFLDADVVAVIISPHGLREAG